VASDNRKTVFALLALAISAFAIGTTEFISVGLLPLIAEDLHISVAASGLTVTLYALGVTFGAPILTSLTSRVSRKRLLLALMLVFIVGNLLAATAGGIAVLLIARVVSALSHGLFMSIGSTIAAGLVPENKRAGAISILFSGLTVATVTGVPLGTFLGQQLGWRAAFFAIAAVGIAAFFANLALVSPNTAPGTPARFRDQAKLAKNGRMLLVFAITALGYGGTFVVFTYLSPLLHEVTGFAESSVSAILLLYGIAIAIGNFVGGKAANRKPVTALLAMFAAQAVVILALAFLAPFKIAGLIAVFFMGLFAFMNVPGLQSYVLILGERLEPQAKDVASALNIAAFNAGIALGAYLGGIVAESLGLVHTAWVGAAMVFGAVLLTLRARTLENRDTESASKRQTAGSPSLRPEPNRSAG